MSEHDELARHIAEHAYDGGCGTLPDDQFDQMCREIADHLSRLGFRKQEPVSDAEVEAALHAFYDQEKRTGYEWRDGLIEQMRAALVAAQNVRNEQKEET